MSASVYSFEDIVKSYAAVGIGAGDVVVVRANLALLHSYIDPSRSSVLDAHYRALRQLVGEGGTIVVPTTSTNLCNTDIPFDPVETPSWQMGVFSEHVRKLQGARRTFHPFVSYSAIGPHARSIVEDTSRQGYGPNSSEARLIDLGAKCLSIGLEPRLTCATVHHAEHLMAVPYRYTKEFVHPVIRNGAVTREPFYLFVTRRDCEMVRNYNVKIMAAFEASYPLLSAPLGAGKVWAYRAADFCKSACDSMSRDIFVWLSREPESKPYRQ